MPPSLVSCSSFDLLAHLYTLAESELAAVYVVGLWWCTPTPTRTPTQTSNLKPQTQLTVHASNAAGRIP